MDHLLELPRKPGEIRDAIFEFLRNQTPEASVSEIRQAVAQRMKGQLAESSVRSYLRLNTPGEFERTSHSTYRLRGVTSVRPEVSPASQSIEPAFCHGQSKLYFADCFQWLDAQQANSFHAIVCDPPYGLVEYTPEQQRGTFTGEAESGASPRHSMGTVALRFPDLPY